MRALVTAFIGLGANLGEPRATLQQAMTDVALIQGVKLIKCSSLYQTAPLASSGPDYVNAVVEIQTILTAPALLAQLQYLEQLAGRERTYQNAPRTLDLDLLIYGDASIESAALVVPHPRMHERAFVLVPLAEIAPFRVRPSQLRAVSGQAVKLVTDC